MLCVVCPHCHQMMTAADEAVGESVACPSCKKSLQVPPNAPRLPQHLAPGGAPAAAQAKAAAVGAPGGRVGAAVAAPPMPGAPPQLGTTVPRTRSTLPKGLLVIVALVAVVGVAAVVVIPKLGGKKAPIVGKKKDPSVSTVDPTTPPDVIPASDLTAAMLFKAYFDNTLAADENYKDKSVTLSGKVAAVGGSDELFVNLYGIDRARDLTKIVRCYFAKSYKDRLKTIGPNSPIRVKGTCKGMSDGRVVIRECSFVSEE